MDRCKEERKQERQERSFCCFDDASLKVLKICDFNSFCGLGRATVKLLDKEQKRKRGMITRMEETV